MTHFLLEDWNWSLNYILIVWLNSRCGTQIWNL